MLRKSLIGLTALVVLSGTSPVFATNGMNLEGYGAKSHALGGASMAYDTGNSAVMNNPATLGMMKEGKEEFGIGIRGLHPDVSLSYGPMSDKSEGTGYYMPSLSYMRKDGSIAWGVAMLAQGGMGTEYGDDSPLFMFGRSYGNSLVPLSGKEIRSEVGVGRVMFPLAWNITENTTIGLSLDLIWASMDLQMDMDGAHFKGMTQGMGGSVSGTMYNTLGSMMQSGGVTDINYMRYDFTNGSPFIGEAVGFGTGFKIGMMHRFSKMLTVGGSYHSRTWISDLETSSAALSFSGVDAMNNTFTQSVTGTIKVRDFEWPAVFAAGFALYPDDRWMIVGDIKQIDWSSSMSKFSTTFIADNSPSNGPFIGKTLDVAMKQEWKDQTVFSIGAQYKATEKLALRAGASFATNPVPDSYLNPLFPAITTNHYTAGFGYRISEKSSFATAVAWAPEVSATNAEGMVIKHGQLNWSLNFTHEL
ncbi:MAG: aromatic hydrocarbon degradation protein [Chlorobiaceae bacterium]|nr:aromatic hydrocarbon degradation protein [Chlorobiaceae bacterium]